MGCDIHAHAERKDTNGNWQRLNIEDPLGGRSYAVFGFLANVRNYSDINPISEARGLPPDTSAEVRSHYNAWRGDAHSGSWLALDELMAVDYSQIIEDRRCMRQLSGTYWSGAQTCSPGEGSKQPLAEFLGEYFMEKLKALKAAGADRVVFWFDN